MIGPMTGVSATPEQRLWCIVIGAYAGLVPGLALLTRLTPVCLPGLIDLNADIEALVLGVIPAIIGVYWLPAATRAITPLLWIGITGALLGLPGGPGPLPDLLGILYALALALVILRSMGKAPPPRRRAVAIALAAALMVLAAGSIVSAIGSGFHDQPLRSQGLVIGSVAGLAALAVMLATSRGAWLRWASEPSTILMGGALALRLLGPYDPVALAGAALMWLVGGLLIAHRCRHLAAPTAQPASQHNGD